MNVTAVRSDWVGRVIDGRFTLLQWLGGSGHSTAFLTELPGEPPQKATIKLISADEADAESRIADWTAATRLSHPHLIRLIQTGRCQVDDTEFLYLVTEYADEILSEILPVRALTPDEVKEMLGPVLDALSYLHRQGLVHSSLKPSNILVVNDQLKLSVDSLRPAGAPSAYLHALSVHDAPERAAGTVSPATDVWSLGVTVVEALTQEPPDWNRSADRNPVVPDSIPQPFAAIARGCLQLEPARRITLGNVMARLGLAQPAPEPAPRPEPARRSAARPEPESGIDKKSPSKPRPSVVIAIVVVLCVVVAIFWMRSHQAQPSSPAQVQQPEPAATASGSQMQKPSAGAPAQAPEQAPAQVPAPAVAPTQAPAQAGPTAGGATAKGSVAQRVQPDILPAATNSIQGRVDVRVRLAVGPGGDVSSATLDSPGPSKYFAKAALQAAQQWKFKPAQENGQPVPSVWIVQFHFTRDATDITPVETTP